MTTRQKIALFFVILVFPALVSATTGTIAFKRGERVEFCASCHTMTPWINDVTGEDGDSLASEHFQHKWIQHDQCYTCHSNYSFFGPLEAKIGGVRHVIAFYTGFKGKIELYKPFPNANCLQCHEHAKAFREDSNHDPLENLLTNKDRCVDCHDNLHNVEQEEASADAGNAVNAAEDGGNDKGADAAKDDGGDDDSGDDKGEEK